MCYLSATVQELKSRKFSLKKRDNLNVVRFHTNDALFAVTDALISVFKCLEPKANSIHFWQGADKCKDGTLK